MALVSLTALPTGFAHYDTGQHPLPYATSGLDVFGSDDDSCGQTMFPADPLTLGGYAGPNCGPGGVVGDVAPGSVFGANRDRISGWYYGAVTYYAELDSDFVIFDGEGDPEDCPHDDPSTPLNEAFICAAATRPVNPSLRFSWPGGLYDLEVRGGLSGCTDGTETLNEEVVDGAPSGGLAPDGMWNDGGYAGVGHLFGYYQCPDYETAGCDRYDQAFAEDAVSGEDVWLQVQCNWGVPVYNGTVPSLVEVIRQFSGDAVNCPRGFPQSCINAVQYLDNCSSLDLIPDHGPLYPSRGVYCGYGYSEWLCGAGDVSSVDFGRGQGSDGPGSAATGPPWPDASSDSAYYPNAGTDDYGVNCDSVAAASAFPLTAVIATQTAGGAVGVENLSVATHGWIA